jgi:hypothetical protein
VTIVRREPQGSREPHRAGEVPLVRSTRPPIADFDGDGVPDAIDPAPFDPSVP